MEWAETIEEIQQINEEVKKPFIGEEGRESLEKLLVERVIKESMLSAKLRLGLLKEEETGNGALKYCLMNFPSSDDALKENLGFSRSALEVKEEVENFIKYIKENEGQRILFTQGPIPRETGFISGQVYFANRNSYFANKNPVNHMYVTVTQLFIMEKGRGWDKARMQHTVGKKEQGGIYDPFEIPSHIFKYPGRSSTPGIWESDYSKFTSLWGGPAQGPTIYVGDSNVEKVLKKGKIKGEY